MVRGYLLLGTLALIAVIASGTASAQADTTREARFVAAFSAAVNLNEPGSWNLFYQRDNDLTPVRIAPAGALAIGYGPVGIVAQAELYFWLEGGYGKAETRDVSAAGRGNGRASFEHLPLLFWTELTTSSTISPFVGVSIGVAHVHFRESYDRVWDPSENLDIAYWDFTWAGKAGIDWRLSTSVALSFYSEYFRVVGKHTVPESGSPCERGIYDWTGEQLYGARVQLSL